MSTPTHGATEGAGPTPEVVARLASVPLFAGRPWAATRLTGGLTNTSYRVDVDGRSYVARLSSPSSALLAIDRDAEYRHSVTAARRGVAPAVAAYVPQAGVLAVEWIEGRTLTGADLRDEAVLQRVAAACRRLHRGPRFTTDFDMFDVQRRYLAVVTRRGFRLPPRYLDRMPAVDRIRAALAGRPLPTVPCHNDLLPANLIDDGERLWLIDYEYSGNNDPCFELGNLWSGSGLEPDLLEALVTAYAGRPSRSLTARARLLGLVSAYGWTLWASIQDGVSALDVDFLDWGMRAYDRAAAEFDGPDLPRLVEEVHLDD